METRSRSSDSVFGFHGLGFEVMSISLPANALSILTHYINL